MPKLFQIFRTGTFTTLRGDQISYSETDLQKMAAVFDPKRRKAPLVLGHPENDQPAMGQAQKLIVKDGKLYALAMVNEALESLVKTRRYAKVSASFLTPFATSNPTPGAYYLKHIGFLGAMPPSVKGMEPLSFSARDDGVCFAEAEAIVTTKSKLVFPRSELNFDPERVVLDRLATEYQEACPTLSYSEAVMLAQSVQTF